MTKLSAKLVYNKGTKNRLSLPPKDLFPERKTTPFKEKSTSPYSPRKKALIPFGGKDTKAQFFKGKDYFFLVP